MVAKHGAAIPTAMLKTAALPPLAIPTATGADDANQGNSGILGFATPRLRFSAGRLELSARVS